MKPLIRITRFYLGVIIVILASGCASMKSMAPPEHATAIEQFLITQAVERSISAKSPTLQFLEPEASIKLETEDGDGEETLQRRYLADVVGQWLGNAGYRLQSDSKKAVYRIKIIVQALGMEQSKSFFGMPPVQSTFIPFSLPEISLFKAQYRNGMTRFRLDAFDMATGKYLDSTPWFQASTYFNEYTVLMFIGFNTTNLEGPLDD